MTVLKGTPAGAEGHAPVDDVLDANADAEEADQRARDQSEQAPEALEIAGIGESDARGYLRDLAEFVVVRER